MASGGARGDWSLQSQRFHDAKRAPGRESFDGMLSDHIEGAPPAPSLSGTLGEAGSGQGAPAGVRYTSPPRDQVEMRYASPPRAPQFVVQGAVHGGSAPPGQNLSPRQSGQQGQSEYYTLVPHQVSPLHAPPPSPFWNRHPSLPSHSGPDLLRPSQVVQAQPQPQPLDVRQVFVSMAPGAPLERRDASPVPAYARAAPREFSPGRGRSEHEGSRVVERFPPPSVLIGHAVSFTPY